MGSSFRMVIASKTACDNEYFASARRCTKRSMRSVEKRPANPPGTSAYVPIMEEIPEPSLAFKRSTRELSPGGAVPHAFRIATDGAAKDRLNKEPGIRLPSCQ